MTTTIVNDLVLLLGCNVLLCSRALSSNRCSSSMVWHCFGISITVCGKRVNLPLSDFEPLSISFDNVFYCTSACCLCWLFASSFNATVHFRFNSSPSALSISFSPRTHVSISSLIQLLLSFVKIIKEIILCRSTQMNCLQSTAKLKLNLNLSRANENFRRDEIGCCRKKGRNNRDQQLYKACSN